MSSRKNKKKEKIFEAALQNFSRNGAEQTTMQEIAEIAGVGKGTLYRYFDNKEGLVSSLIEIGFEKLMEMVEDETKDISNPRKKLEKAVKTHLEFFNQNRDFCKFMTRESLGHKNQFERHIKKIRSNNTVLIENIIREGVEAGLFKNINVEMAATSLIGAVNITALHWFMFKEDFPVTEIADNIINIFFTGMEK